MGKWKMVAAILGCIVLVGLIPVREASAIESLTVGLKYWYPQWELSGYSNFETIKWDTDYGMLGPTASMVFSEHFAMSVSLFSGSFSKDFTEITFQGYNANAKWSSTRTDLDAAFAYIMNRYVNFFAGVKYLTYDQTIDGTYDDYAATWDVKYDMSAAGAGLGTGLNLPLGESPFALYGTVSLSYLTGTFKTSGSDTTGSNGDVTYPIYSGEAGIRYNLEHFVLMGSLRYQKSTIDITWSGVSAADSLDETFWGVILFAGYRFNF